MKRKVFNEIASKALSVFCAILLAFGMAAPLSLAVTKEAEAATFTKQVVGTQTDNIEVHLFNYGNLVNRVSGDSVHFNTETKANELDDILLESPSCSYYNQTFAYMDDLVDGYPVVTRWFNEYRYTSCYTSGSWRYLFDKDVDYLSGTGGDASYSTSSSNYAVKHFDVNNVQLFSYDNETGYYSYDSRYNAAEYDYESKTLSSYNYALRSKSIGNKVSNQGAFLPFNQAVFGSNSNVTQLTDAEGDKCYSSLPSGMTGMVSPGTSFPGNYIARHFGLDPKDYGMQPESYYFDNHSGYGPANLYLIPSEAAPNLFALQAESDLAFGMSVEFDFYMPEGGIVNGERMVYEFAGDDDMVVYIDDKCVLNLAGQHEAIRGSIDFSTGVVSIYEDGKSWENSNYRGSGANGLGLDRNLSSIFDLNGRSTFEDGSIHTVKIFYMERVGGASNCKMKFNMPVVPKGNMSVSKVEENVNDALQGVEEYDFILTNGTTGAARAEEPYSVVSLEDYGTLRSGKTGANGEFTLKGSEMAIFNLMDIGTPVKVRETSTGQYTTAYSVDGGSRVSAEQTGSYTVQKEYPNFVFYNKWDSADITVAKAVVCKDGAAITGNPDYVFTLKLGANSTSLAPYAGPATGATVANGVFALQDHGAATIVDVPVGWTFTLSEAEPLSTDDYTYEKPQFTGKSNPVEFGAPQTYTVASGTNAVTVTNTCIPVPKYADLTIAKSGVDVLDYHAVNATSGEEEEYQSTLYTVKGTGKDGTSVSLEVAVHGNNSVTIANLPIGNYTVTEKTDWSWRYGLDSIATALDKKPTTNIKDGSISFALTKEGETVTFTNKRTLVQWLAGDNFVMNVFDSSSTKKMGADFGSASATA